MKNSYYNLYGKCPQGMICFNTLHNTYIILNKEHYESLHNQTYKGLSDKQLQVLIENGFITKDTVNEYQEFIEKTENLKQNKTYNLIILPTLDCNVRCWYCFEKQIPGSRLSDNIRDRIYKYTCQILDREDIYQLNINLFGGEPMLHFKEDVYPLLTNIKDYAQQNKKKLNISAVSNATCITDDIIPLLAQLNITFQISIDGYKDKHNTIKKIPNCAKGTYEIVINVLHKLTKVYNPDINLRINYDNQTLKHLKEILNDISDIDRSRIRIHLERVWQTYNKMSKKNNDLIEALNNFMREGFLTSYLNFHPKYFSCISDSLNEAVISYNADVYKCTGRDFSLQHKEGTLSITGNIEWYSNKINKRVNLKTYDNSMCRSCKFLPQCQGPCSQNN